MEEGVARYRKAASHVLRHGMDSISNPGSWILNPKPHSHHHLPTAGILQQPHQLHIDIIPELTALLPKNGFSNPYTDEFRDGQPFSQPTSPKSEFSQFGAAEEASQGRLRVGASATPWGLVPEGRLGGRLGGSGEAMDCLEREQEVIVPESDSEEQYQHPLASGRKERRGLDLELVGLLGKWKGWRLWFLPKGMGGWEVVGCYGPGLGVGVCKAL